MLDFILSTQFVVGFIIGTMFLAISVAFAILAACIAEDPENHRHVEQRPEMDTGADLQHIRTAIDWQ